MTLEKEQGALAQYYLKYEDDPDFIAEGMATTVIEDALRIMQKQALSRSQLADAMGISRPQVSRLFNAPPNLTLRSIARLGVALGVKPLVSLDPVVVSLARTVESDLDYKDELENVLRSLGPLVELIRIIRSNPDLQNVIAQYITTVRSFDSSRLSSAKVRELS